MLIDRVRTTENIRPAVMVGVSYSPDTPRTYPCGPSSFIGFKKTIVDKVSSRVVSRVKVRGVYKKSDGKRIFTIADQKPVRIQSYKGYAPSVTLDTRGTLPGGYTNYKLVGPVANCLMGSGSMPNTLYGGKYWMDLSRSPIADSLYVSWCLQKAYNERATPDGELSVALAELPQLIGLLTSPFKAISVATKKIRALWCGDAWVFNPQKGLVSLRTKRRYPGRKVSRKFLDEAANRWLELQFGLLPTIGDAETVIDAINEKLDVIREVMYGKSKYTAYKKEIVYRGLTAGLGPMWTVHGKAKYTGKIQYTSKCYFKYKGVPDYIQRLGFRPEDLWNVLWELTPWSFVVDWLFDIGGLLHSLAYDHLLVNVGNYVSVKYDQKLLVETDRVMAWQYQSKCPTSRLYLHQEELLRQVNLDVPLLPQFNVKWFNITRSFNALSLLWQQLPR